MKRLIQITVVSLTLATLLVAGEFLSAPYQAAADCGDIRDRDCDGIPDVVEHRY